MTSLILPNDRMVLYFLDIQCLLFTQQNALNEFAKRVENRRPQCVRNYLYD